MSFMTSLLKYAQLAVNKTTIAGGGGALKSDVQKLARQIVGCTRTNFQSFGSAGYATMVRGMIYCPAGATQPQLVFTGWLAGAIEVASAKAFPITVSVSVDEPAPWDATKTYQPGDKITYFATSGGSGNWINNSSFTCLVANTNSPPKQSNSTNWATGSRPIPVPVTWNGTRDGTVPTITLPSGTTETQAHRISDKIPVVVPVGGYLTFYVWLAATTDGLYPAPLTLQGGKRLGGCFTRGASQADLTMTQTLFGGSASVASVAYTPCAVLGIPLVATPSAAVFTDSVGAGTIGSAAPGAWTVNNGGSGFNIGDLVTLDVSGLTAGAMASGSNLVGMVDTVSSGAIASVQPVSSGGFSGTSSQTGQTQPTGVINLIAVTGSGTGASLNITTMGAAAYDEGDIRGCYGAIGGALGQAGIPHVLFGSPGDRVNLYTNLTNGCSRRMGLASILGAKNAIIELGNNDYVTGDSAATIITNLTTLAARIRGLGFEKVFMCTITPGSTSTSAAGCSTTASQTAGGLDSVRQAVNAWLRTTAVSSGISDGCMDITALVEEGGATAPTGKWNPINGLPAAADGKHPGKDANKLMMPAITAMVAKFAA